MEGVVDEVVIRSVLSSRDLEPAHVIITGGKSTLDARIARYNQAARLQPWLVVRDSDHDGAGCAVTLRGQILAAPTAPGLCLRLAVRTIEAWLLADQDMFASFFGVARSRVPAQPEQLDRPKDAVVAMCRRSRRKEVRAGMAPPEGRSGVGPEYTSMVSDFVGGHWRPDAAAPSADSLARALRHIDRLVVDGTW